MKYSHFLVLVFLFGLGFIPSHAQQSVGFTLKDAMFKRFTEYYPERPQQLQWLPEGDLYSVIKERDDEPYLMIFKGDASKELQSISLDEINTAFEQMEITFSSFPRIQWLSNQELFLSYQNRHLSWNRNSKKVEELFLLPEGAEHVRFNDERTACVYLLNDNLYYLDRSGNSTQITEDGGNGIVYGQAVHRSEFGITDGIFWAPNQSSIAFYRMDETMVTDYPLVDITTTPASLNNIKYPMAGGTSHHVTLHHFNARTGETVKMQTGEPMDQYLTAVSWDPVGENLFIGLLNRDQNHLKLNRYNASNGSLEQTLFEEKDDAYVEPENPLYFVPGTNGEFIWKSERDGFDHLYVYNKEGNPLRQLTIGLWEVERIIGFDEKSQTLYVEGTGEVIQEQDRKDDSKNALDRFTYAIDYVAGTKEIIEERSGTHVGMLSEDGKWLMEHLTSVDVPWETTLYTSRGERKRQLLKSDDPTEVLGIPKPELITFGRPEHDLYARIIKPSDFDPTKKYPLFLYVYGGPHAQLVRNTFLGAAPLWMYWLAEQGVVVATVDNRGSDNRGIAFEQSTFRNLGIQEMIDQKDFVDYLIQQGYIDQDRMAIHGWSYGGFMTINMMQTFPGTFQAGIAGGPVCDWSLYEVMYTERYMDTPEANPDGFAKARLTDRVGSLADDLLVIHGTIDDVVVWQHSQQLVKACVEQDIQLDYFIYPEHPHNVRGRDRYHLMEKVLDYALARIKPEVDAE